MERVKIPAEIHLPKEAAKWGEEPRKLSIDEALFPYWLRIDPRLAGFLTREIRLGRMYRTRMLERKDKPPRRIDEPLPILKFVQRRILDRVLRQTTVHDAAHGFVRGRSIFTNAEVHTGQQIVVCMDLRDFFPSITFRRVTGVFSGLGFGKAAASMLAGLCCFEGRLPQGAPTSPMITNLICRRMDARLHGLLEKCGGRYTRYADDLTFSGDPSVLSVLPMARRIVKEEGFSSAPEKFRIQRRGSRQKVTGLVVNDKVTVPRPVRRLLRAMVHRFAADPEKDPRMLRFLMGYVNFMKPAHPGTSKRLAAQLEG
jgi:retron-type reverse transcriptase